jgi:hypothetical protein
MATFKRPTLKRVWNGPSVFVSVQQGGAKVSQWVLTSQTKSIPTGSPGVVGEICTKMHRGDCVKLKETSWTPPYDYEFYARRMLPESEQEAYIERCRTWVAEHPPRIPKTPNPPLNIDLEKYAKFWAGKKNMPPLAERVAMLRDVGFPEARVEKHIAWDKMMEETSEQRQKVIDDIFGVDVPKKSKVQKTKVVLKPVKKKMP